MTDLLAGAEPPVTIFDAITEVERELRVRAKVFPRWIDSGKLSSTKAALQIARLEKARDILVEVAKTVPRP